MHLPYIPGRGFTTQTLPLCWSSSCNFPDFPDKEEFWFVIKISKLCLVRTLYSLQIPLFQKRCPKWYNVHTPETQFSKIYLHCFNGSTVHIAAQYVIKMSVQSMDYYLPVNLVHFFPLDFLWTISTSHTHKKPGDFQPLTHKIFQLGKLRVGMGLSLHASIVVIIHVQTSQKMVH